MLVRFSLDFVSDLSGLMVTRFRGWLNCGHECIDPGLDTQEAHGIWVRPILPAICTPAIQICCIRLETLMDMSSIIGAFVCHMMPVVKPEAL
jgi:hypothetical protein